MSDQTFKSISEQLEILKIRGLSIPDERFASEFLLWNNYYRVSGYTLTLRKHDVFYRGTTFQNVVDIYSFDHELRHLLLHYIDCIEVGLKSLYAHEFTKLYGAAGYLDEHYFTDIEQYHRIMEKVEMQKTKRHPFEAYLKHFMDDLKRDIPLWAYVDLMTISDISLLYKISEENLKRTIACHYGLTMNDGYSILGKYMHSMTIIRNLCAHGSRLFNRLFEQKPSLNKTEKALLVRDDKGNIDNAHLFGFLLIMRRILSKRHFAEFKDRLMLLADKYPFVNMRHYGFREDWREKL